MWLHNRTIWAERVNRGPAGVSMIGTPGADVAWTGDSVLGAAAVFGVIGLLFRWLSEMTSGKKMNGKRPPPKPGSQSEGLRNVGNGALAIGVVFGLASILPYAKEAGFVPHSMTASVFYPEHGWEVGEYQYCTAFLNSDGSAILNCNPSIEKLTPTREMDIKMWAEIKPGAPALPLKCQRESDDITCHTWHFEPRK
jgi:hypothetical protein